MKHLKTWWLIVAVLLAVPPVASMVLGFLWLWEHRAVWIFAVATGLIVAGLTPVIHWLRRRGMESPAEAAPSPDWPPAGQEAWKRVDAIARRAQQEPFSLEHFGDAERLLREVLAAVASYYHPRSKEPVLEVPAPYALRIAELALGDLREALTEYVPGAHILTIRDLGRLRRAASLSRQLYGLYRLASLGFAPTSAILRELRDLLAGRLMDASIDDIRRWAVGFCVRRCGFYAIQLYSGNLVLSGVKPPTAATRRSRRDELQAADDARRLADEPLRILVVGQVKAGKSSLINALFGETRAATDVIPVTRSITPYVLERDGIERALILDSAGYAAGDSEEEPLAGLRDELLRIDLVVLVATVTSAARAPDRRLLDAVRAAFQAAPERVMPPVLVALTHIDLLRPLAEWDPPYNLVEPDTPKARNLADAVQAVADDLAVDTARVVPVCLKPGMEYNVEEGLEPAVLAVLSEAQRVRALRCLRDQHDREVWERLGRQALASGRLLWRAGRGRLQHWLGR